MPYIPVLTQGTLTEFNTTQVHRLADRRQPVRDPAVWQAPDNAQVMKRLKPAAK